MITLDRKVLFLVAASVVLIGACSQTGSAAAPATPASDGSPAAVTDADATEAGLPEAPRGPQFGTAGIIPRNYPSGADADWIAMFEGINETGGLVGVYGGWTDINTPAGRIPDAFNVVFGASGSFGDFTAVAGLGFATEDIRTGVMQPTVDWTDPDAVASFTEVAVAIARTHEPELMIVGAEINRIWEQHPENYAAFVAAWPALYDAIKVASPDTEVGTGFRYEFMRGAGFLSGESRDPQWHLVDAFRDHADFIALSSYPYFDYESPADIPADYYIEAGERIGLPIAFSELGWPSRPLSSVPDSPYGGSEVEQAAFAERFLELIADVDVRFALWSFQHDLGEFGGPAFESVSLRENDGTPKPVLAVWAAASN